MTLLIELQILTTAVTLFWFEIFGGHRFILRLTGNQPWDHIKPITCWFCTQQYFGFATIGGWQLTHGLDVKQLILFVCLNMIVSKFMDDRFGFDIGLREENSRLEKENQQLKNK